MKHAFIEIWNFKGIDHIRLDFNAHPRSNVYTLVGLNESGKTTILEALNFLTYKTETLDPLNLHGYSIKDVHELIPISKRSNFNGEVKICVGYTLDEDDKKKITTFVSANTEFTLCSPLADEITVEQTYKFKNSILESGQPSTTWGNFNLIGKPQKGRKTEKKLDRSNWLKVVNFTKSLIPSVLYFPNFLFEFPDKIYLDEAPVDKDKHEFYRTVLQDVLDAVDENATLETHIMERARDGGWFARRALDSVLLKMGSNITKTVFSNWNRIFKRTSGGKEIVLNVDFEDAEVVGSVEPQKLLYLQLQLKDGSEYYSISERSLGFRWFFAFLLLTTYRGFRKDAPDNVLFMFDEPASNLHSSAQSQLLESFGKFSENLSIVYTTHSHHLINPEWLEGTFVVKNQGLEYDDSYDSYNATNTKISLYKYRDFAAQHPDQTTYFQPILDVLDYSPSKLENIPDVVMIEGKNDFYTLKYFNKLLPTSYDLNLMPGGGAGSLDAPIQLYLGWGRNFIVILDSDEAGEKEKSRYVEKFGGLVSDRIFSLGDIDSVWKKKSMESLIDPAERLAIQQSVYAATTKYAKKHFNRAVQELYLTSVHHTISIPTQNNFDAFMKFCEAKLKSI